ncbi:PREDICTED: uncharacterized protein LOC108660645 [Theobroma cacao]|uniref:Uncharacterized protein LOC108660645 n=1 Tax=Theobroma cacao TaxID=3641 RepID=A0AB32VSX2_THECC|nr:PREDICTED: uncharacterized protein LOC108660645 [Theobroma cacao]
MSKTDAIIQSYGASLRNLETQMGQLVKSINSRPQGALPSDTQVNPKALENMPSYVKFLKDILTKKRKLEDFETMALIEEWSAIIQNKLPPKLKDPGCFSIPCTVGRFNFTKALCDLGVGVAIIPLSIAEKIGLKEIQPTIVSLQLADRTIRYPVGIIEDVLVKVGPFYIPVDFIVLEMEED